MSLIEKLIERYDKILRYIEKLVLGDNISQEIVKNINPKQPENKNEEFMYFLKTKNSKPYSVKATENNDKSI